MKYLFPLLLCVSLVRGATAYYVDSDYGGTESGSTSQPWSDLANGWATINTTLASDDVVVYFSARAVGSDVDDVYSAGVIDVTQRTDTGSNTLEFDGKTLYNTDDGSPSWTTQLGSGRASVEGFISQNGSHIKYSNVTIRGFTIVRTTSGKAVSIAGDNWILTECDISHGSGVSQGPLVLLTPTADGSHEGSGAWSPPCDNIAIIDNTVHDSYGELIYLGGGGSVPGSAGSGYPSHTNVRVAGNVLYNGGTRGAQGDAIDIKGGLVNVTIARNEIRNTTSTFTRPIVTQGQTSGGPVQNLVIEGNWIHDYTSLGDGAIVLANTWGVPRGVTIRNNLIDTVSGSQGAGIIVYDSQDAVAIYNNTIYGTSDNAVRVSGSGGATVRNNLMWNNTGTMVTGATTSDYNVYRGTIGSSEGSNSYAMSSLESGTVVRDAPGGDFTIASPSSAAVGRATTIFSFNDDRFGNVRTVPWDAGAHEFTGPQPPPPDGPPGVADIVFFFEDDWTNPGGSNPDSGFVDQGRPGWYADHLPHAFAALTYPAPNTPSIANMETIVAHAKALNFGYIYPTTDADGNPWNNIPTYWTALTNEVPKLLESHAYTFRVKGAGDYSNELVLTTETEGDPAPTPAAPTLSVQVTGSTTTTLSWNNTGGATFDVERDAGTIATVTSTTYGDSGLSASTSYDYRVRVATPVASAWSATVTVTTDATPTEPPTGGDFRFVVPDDFAGSGFTAFQNAVTDSRLRPGDRVLVRNGTYTVPAGSALRPTVSGALNNNIEFVSESLHGVVLTKGCDTIGLVTHNPGGSNPNAILVISGWPSFSGSDYLTFAGFRFLWNCGDRLSTVGGSNSSQISNPPAPDVPSSEGVITYGRGVRIVHCVTQEGRQGIVCQTGRGVGTEIYGNLIVNTGWRSSSGREWHGTGIYCQHGIWVGSTFVDSPPLVVENNFITATFSQFAGQFFGSDNAYTTGLRYERNILVGNPSTPTGHCRFIIGGQNSCRLEKAIVNFNTTKELQFDVGYAPGIRHANTRCEDNYFMPKAGRAGFLYTEISDNVFPAVSTPVPRPFHDPAAWQSATVLRNTVVGAGAETTQVTHPSDGGGHYVSGGNVFAGGGVSFYNAEPNRPLIAVGGASLWASQMGDGTSTFTGLPTTDRVIAFPSKYGHRGKAIVHVSAYDHDGNGSVSVALSGMIPTGTTYNVYNMLDLTNGGAFAGAFSPIASGTFGGGSITVSISGLSWHPPDSDNVTLPLSHPSNYAALLITQQ